MQENVNIPDSNITASLTFRQLVLMNMQQLTNFPYIEKDFDALTDYELLCLVVKFLNEVIANQNEQNDSITSMYQAFLNLQSYVNNTKDTLENAFNTLDDYVRNYFANLDVQDEIDNKLDEYVEDGTLEHIIASYLQTQKIYNTHTEMIADASNLVDGLTVQTLGYYNLNDGGGAFYKITDTVSATEYQEEVGTLYATLIFDNEINVNQIGCKNDGLTNNSTILNNFVENISNYNVNKIIIPSGTYVIDETILFDTVSNITIENYGIIKGLSSDTAENPIFKFQDCSNINLIGFNITSTLDKTEPAPTGHTRVDYSGSNRIGFLFNRVNHTIIKDLKIENMYEDIRMWNDDLESNEYNTYININGWFSRNSSQPIYASHISFTNFYNLDFIVKNNLGYGNHFLYLNKWVHDINIKDCNLICNDNNFGHGIAMGNSIDHTENIININIDNIFMKNANFFVFGTDQYCDFNITNSTFEQVLRTDTSSGTSVVACILHPNAKVNMSNCIFRNISSLLGISITNSTGIEVNMDNCKVESIESGVVDSYILYASGSATANTINIKNSLFNCGKMIYLETNTTLNNINLYNNVIIPSKIPFSIRNNTNKLIVKDCIVNPISTVNFCINNGGSVTCDGIKLLNSFFYNFTYMYQNTERTNITLINTYFNDTLLTLPT